MNFWQAVKSFFVEPKIIVRRIPLSENKEVFGVVEKVTTQDHYGASIVYWSIRWNDQPHMIVTLRSSMFIWTKGYWTQFER